MLSLSIVGTLYYVQSESFSNFITKIVRDYLKGTQFEGVEFEKISLNAFPPTLVVKSISASYYDGGKYIDIILDDINLEFIPDEIFSDKISFSTLKLNRGSLAIRQKENQPLKTSKITLKEILDYAVDKIPVRFASLEINQTDINYNEEYLVYLNQLKIYRGLKSFDVYIDSPEVKLANLSEITLENITLEAKLEGEKIDINKLNLIVNDQEMSIEGSITKPLQEESRGFSLAIDGKVDVTVLNSFPKVKSIGEFESGLIDIKGEFTKKKQIYGSFAVSGKNLLCDYVKASSLNAKIIYKESGIYIDKAEIYDDDGSVKLERPFELYSFEKKEFVNDIINVNASSFPMKSALRYIKGIVEPLYGRINGPVSFSLFSADHFAFQAGTNTRAEKVELTITRDDNSQFNILSLDWLEIGGMYFVYKNEEFFIEGEARSPKSVIQVNGVASDKGLRFNMPQARLELADLGKIAGFDIQGNGVFDILIEGKTSEEVILNIKGLGESLEYEGNILGDAELDISFFFNQLKLLIAKGAGVIDSYEYSLTGDINVEPGTLSLRFLTDDLGFSSVQRLTKKLIFDDLPISLDFVSGRVAGNVFIGGTFDDIQIDGEILDSDFWVSGEYIRDAKSTFSKRGNKILIEKSSGKVAGGSLHVDGYYVLEKSLYENFSVIFENIEISQLTFFNDPRLKFVSRLNGKLELNHDSQNQQGNLSLQLSKTSTQSRTFEDSYFKAKLAEEKILIESNLIGIFKTSGSIVTEDAKKSELLMTAKTKQLENIFSFFGVDPEIVSLKGESDIELKTKFNIDDLSTMDLSLFVNKFKLSKDSFYLENMTSGEVVKIENGVIEQALVKIIGNESEMNLSGDGDLKTQFKLVNIGQLNAKFFEFFRDYWILSEGHINWNFELSKTRFQDMNYLGRIWSSNWDVNFVDLPISPRKFNFELLIDNTIFTIKKADIETPKGNLVLTGEVEWEDFAPIVNLRMELDNTRLQLASDSYLDLGGELSLNGNEFPLFLEGKIFINDGTLRDGLISSFVDNENSIKHPDNYLPKSIYDKRLDLLEMGVEIVSNKAVYFTNNWLSLPVEFNLRVEGSERKPILDGKIESVSSLGKFNFKDTDYIIREGIVSFSASDDYTNPYLNIEADAVISSYRINARIIGPLESYSVLLTSSPPLESNDILALITLGYVQSSSQETSEDDRGSLASVGVGSLLLDQLKIRKLLRDNLGLVLSVKSQEQEVNSGFLSSRNGGDSIVDGRTQTTTRVQVTKQLSDKFNVSMARDLTVDYQGLNLNYTVNPDVTVKGIIEQQNNLEVVEGANNDTAVGVDVNFNWTFK